MLAKELSPIQIEFIAEEELIEIEPRKQCERLHFITGDFGPFRPPARQHVPLWLALILKKHGDCAIIPPSWLEVNWLTDKYNSEILNQDEFTPLPPHFFEISNLLFKSAEEDILECNAVRSLVQNISQCRLQKIINGVQAVNGGPVKLNCITRMELAAVKRIFIPLTEDFIKINEK